MEVEINVDFTICVSTLVSTMRAAVPLMAAKQAGQGSFSDEGEFVNKTIEDDMDKDNKLASLGARCG